MARKVLILITIVLSAILILSGCGEEKNNNVLKGLYVPQINTTDDYEMMYNTPAILVLFKDGIQFNEDNTCLTSIDSFICSYKYEDKLYKITITDNNPGELTFEFSKINDNEIKDNFGYTWKKEIELKNNSSTSNSTDNKSLKMDKDYFVVGTNTGKKAYISFQNDGTCKPKFWALSNSGRINSSGEKINITYQSYDPECTYTIKDNIISVSWLGTIKQSYTFKRGDGKIQTADMFEYYIMKDIEFKYNEETDSIDTYNGEWKIQPGESFFILAFEINGKENNSNSNTNDNDNFDNSTESSDNNDIIKEDNSNNPDDNINNNENKNNSTNNTDKDNIEVNPIDEIKVEITTDDYDKHYIELSNVTSALKEYYINGELIDQSNYYSSKFIEIEREGENCVNYKLVGNDGYVKEGKECYTFEPQTPRIDITIFDEDDCYFYLKDFRSYGGDNMYYNKLKEIEITYDGVMIQESPNIRPADRELIKQEYFGYIHTTAGKHTITFTNRFGKVQTEELEFSEKCDASFD